MGFPTRISRSIFPQWLMRSLQILKPEECLTDAQINHLAWQIIGAGLTAPLAWFTFDSIGVRLASAESWNGNASALLRPVSAKTATGIYTLTFAATYPNEKGVAVPLEIKGAKAFPQSTTANTVATPSVSGQVVTVKTTTANTGAAIDAACLVEIV